MRPLTDYTSVTLTNCFLNQISRMEKDRMKKKKKKEEKSFSNPYIDYFNYTSNIEPGSKYRALTLTRAHAA